MLGVKLLLGVAAICSALAAVLLLWNESKVSCGYYTTKCFETLFVISALALTKECAEIKIK